MEIKGTNFLELPEWVRNWQTDKKSKIATTTEAAQKNYGKYTIKMQKVNMLIMTVTK